MAVTSIWPIKGRVDHVINYARNPEKTSEGGQSILAQLHTIDGVMEYAANEVKTERRAYVSCLNCREDTAAAQFMETKRLWGKTEGRVCYHGYQSFKAEEVTAETAHEIGVKLAQELWGDRFEVLVATHCNTGHYHNHFVINSVSYMDGYKFYNSPADYARMREVSDRLCREYQLSIIERPQGRGKNYGEWKAQQENRPTWRGLVRADVDEAIRQSMTERQFFDALRRKGYEVKIGKDISVRPPGKERFVRLARNFGEDYAIEGIRRRILEQSRPERPMQGQRRSRTCKVRGKVKPVKATGFRALYFHYCYLLGIFPQKPQKHKRAHFLLREDLIKMDAITQETRLLARHHIDTAQQLSLYQAVLEQQIEALTADRKDLYRQRRTVAVKSDENKLAEVQGRITEISRELSRLRKEVKHCDNIAQRSGVMLEKLQTVREDENQRKEKMQHEQLRGRSGTGRAIQP